jgi:PTS system nitrogen regulatory IIA component
MQLTVRDVTKFLNVSETTVHRWIKQRGLPAQQVAGQYRFNRAELLEWATSQKIKVSVELFADLNNEAGPIPGVASALEAGGIFHNVLASSKETAIQALIDVLLLPEGVDRLLLLQLFLAREALASTAIGDGIAIPHVRSPIVLNVSTPMITLCFLEKPIEFGALDGQPVHVLFSLVSSTVRTHLHLLSRLSFALHDAKFKDAVMRHAPRDEILTAARQVEGRIKDEGSR